MRSDSDKLRAWQNRSRVDLARKTGLRQRSPRKAERWRAIADASAEALSRDGYRCQARGLAPGDCAGPLDPHHVFARSVRPDLVAEVANIIAVCSFHHRFIDANPSRSNVLGLHGFSGDTLAELAARRRRIAL